MKIVDALSKLIMNVSFMWLTYGHGMNPKDYLSSREMALSIIFTLLKTYPTRENIVLECLVSLGTLMLNNMSIQLKQNYDKNRNLINPFDFINLTAFTLPGAQNIKTCLDFILSVSHRQ